MLPHYFRLIKGPVVGCLLLRQHHILAGIVAAQGGYCEQHCIKGRDQGHPLAESVFCLFRQLLIIRYIDVSHLSLLECCEIIATLPEPVLSPRDKSRKCFTMIAEGIHGIPKAITLSSQQNDRNNPSGHAGSASNNRFFGVMSSGMVWV